MRFEFLKVLFALFNGIYILWIIWKYVVYIHFIGRYAVYICSTLGNILFCITCVNCSAIQSNKFSNFLCPTFT